MPEATSTASGVPPPVAAEFERWLEEFGSAYEQALERFVRGKRKEYAWDESEHPRHPAGDDRGGEFAPKDSTLANELASYSGRARLSDEAFAKMSKAEQDALFNFTGGDTRNAAVFAIFEKYAYELPEDKQVWHLTKGKTDSALLSTTASKKALARLKQDLDDFGVLEDYKELSLTLRKGTKVLPLGGKWNKNFAYQDELLVLTESVRGKGYYGVEAMRDYATISERLSSIDEEAMRELKPALERAADEFVAFVRRALKESPQSPEWVNALEFDPGMEFSAAVERMFERAWLFARDIAFEREYADPPDLGRLPQSAQRYFRTKRFWVTGLVGKDLTRQAQGILLAGMKSGASVDTIAARLGEIMDEATDARLRTIVRTNVTDAYNQGVLVEMRSPDMQGIVKAVEYVAVLDDRTTEVCEYLDGTVFRLNDPRLDALNPPNHFNCRSVLSPVVEGQRVGRSRYINASKFRRAQSLIPPGFGGTK